MIYYPIYGVKFLVRDISTIFFKEELCGKRIYYKHCGLFHSIENIQ